MISPISTIWQFDGFCGDPNIFSTHLVPSSPLCSRLCTSKSSICSLEIWNLGVLGDGMKLRFSMALGVVTIRSTKRLFQQGSLQEDLDVEAFPIALESEAHVFPASDEAFQAFQIDIYNHIYIYMRKHMHICPFLYLCPLCIYIYMIYVYIYIYICVCVHIRLIYVCVRVHYQLTSWFCSSECHSKISTKLYQALPYTSSTTWARNPNPSQSHKKNSSAKACLRKSQALQLLPPAVGSLPILAAWFSYKNI